MVAVLKERKQDGALVESEEYVILRLLLDLFDDDFFYGILEILVNVNFILNSQSENLVEAFLFEFRVEHLLLYKFLQIVHGKIDG